VRKLNEDDLLVREEIGLWVVVDGMGGHGGGDLASSAIVASLKEIGALDSAADLLAQFESSIIKVNADLRALAQSKGSAVIGATIVAILIHGAHYACVWCGDSRAYLLREGALTRISHDHSEVQDLVDRGVLEPDEARKWPRRNVVTRALGVAEQPALDIRDGAVRGGDRFLLCSDGLTDHVEDGEIAKLLAEGDPQSACDRLVALTLERGAADNVSIVVVACDFDTRTVRSERPWRGEAEVPDRGIGG